MDGFHWDDNSVSDDIDRVVAMLGGGDRDGDDLPEMSHLDHEARTRDFWGSLSAEQLHYLRTMMLAIAEASGPGKADSLYHVGVAETLLRFKYGICPRCLQSHDTGENFEEVMSSKRHYRAACKQFGVIPTDTDASDFSVGSVKCGDCGTLHDSLAARMVASGPHACPGCSSTAAAKKT